VGRLGERISYRGGRDRERIRLVRIFTHPQLCGAKRERGAGEEYQQVPVRKRKKALSE
jgi:hypothetical protein